MKTETGRCKRSQVREQITAQRRPHPSPSRWPVFVPCYPDNRTVSPHLGDQIWTQNGSDWPILGPNLVTQVSPHFRYLLAACTDARLAPKWVISAPNRTHFIPGLFQIRLQPNCTEIWSENSQDFSHLGPIWPTLESNWHPCVLCLCRVTEINTAQSGGSCTGARLGKNGQINNIRWNTSGTFFLFR